MILLCEMRQFKYIYMYIQILFMKDWNINVLCVQLNSIWNLETCEGKCAGEVRLEPIRYMIMITPLPCENTVIMTLLLYYALVLGVAWFLLFVAFTCHLQLMNWMLRSRVSNWKDTYENSNIQSRGFEISRELTVRAPLATHLGPPFTYMV